MQEHQQA